MKLSKGRGRMVGVNLIEATGRFHASEAASRDIAALMSEKVWVEYNASTMVAEVRLSITEEDALIDQAQAAIERMKTIENELRAKYEREDLMLFGFSISGEELIAVAGNYHLRGSAIPTG